MPKDLCPDEDRDLVARFNEGDARAFEQLVKKYQQTILNLVYHYIGSKNDIEDIAQTIFTKTYYSLAKFDNRRPFFPWLYRIAVNQCYDELRRIKRQKTHTFSELNIEETSQIDKLVSRNELPHEKEENQQEMIELLNRVLDQLPEQQKMSIVLRDIEGVTYTVMAEIMQCSEQAARLKVFRARTRLKKILLKALRA
ncbi:MAG TPA: sigma-70 family RNA polymerase sigma factor [Acidobacteriota bacterium]|nr:sigma-70 family RNA polymerase sigma factor [Acidobacteriota bacterium]